MNLDSLTRRSAIKAGLAGAAATTSLARPALAQQAFPSRPVTLVIPFGAGGPTDVVARTVAQAMSTRLGQAIVVENVAGAGGNIGAARVAGSAADGYTMLLMSTAMTINPALYPKPGYALNQFETLGFVGVSPLWLCVGENSPFRSLKDLVDDIRQNPGRRMYASGGNGTTSHLGVELMKRRHALDIVHVPYRSSAQLFPDLISGKVDFVLWPVAGTEQFVKAGKMKALAVAADARVTAFPEVPTFAQAGYPGVEVLGWFGIAVPRGTPAPAAQKLEDALHAALADTQVRDTLQGMGTAARIATRAEFSRYVQSEADRWTEMVKVSGARVD